MSILGVIYTYITSNEICNIARYELFTMEECITHLNPVG